MTEPSVADRVKTLRQKVDEMYEAKRKVTQVMEEAGREMDKSLLRSRIEKEEEQTSTAIEQMLTKMEKRCLQVKQIADSIKGQEGVMMNERQIEMEQNYSKIQRELKEKEVHIQSLKNAVSDLEMKKKVHIEQIARLQTELLNRDKKLHKFNSLKTKLRNLKGKVMDMKIGFIEIKNQIESAKITAQRERTDFQSKFSEILWKIIKKESSQQQKIQTDLARKKNEHRSFQYDLLLLADIERKSELDNNTYQYEKYFYQEMSRFIKYNHTFANSKTITTLEQKQWLLQNISPFLGGGNRFSTKLLYKFDPLNKTSFHHYVDGKHSILIAMRAVNGLIMGGYSHTPIEKGRTDKHEKAMLFELTRKKKYMTKKEVKSSVVPFDDFYIIFGNSEIRIKGNETKLYSNFGASTGIFEVGNDKVEDFFGEKSTEIDVQLYEVYEINAK